MKVNTNIVSDKFENEAVVVNLNTGVYYSLRETAFEIWKLIENGDSRASIAACFPQLSESQNDELTKFIDFLITDEVIVNDEQMNESNSESLVSLEFGTLDYSKFNDMTNLIMLDPVHESDQNKGWPNKG